MILARPQERNIYAFIDIVSPSKAKEYLALSNGNREIKNGHVTWLADMMRRNEFKLTHQGIAFDSNDCLVDGHHRLNAVIESNKSVEMLIVKNIDNSYDYIDQGAIRTNSDILNIDKRISETLRLAALVFYGSKKPSVTQLRELMDTPLLAALNETLSICPNNVKVFTSSPCRLAVAMLLLNNTVPDKEYIKEQFSALCYADFELMSAASKAFFKQSIVKENKTNTTKMYLFARAIKALDKKNKHLTRIALTDDLVFYSNMYIKNVLAQFIAF